MEPAQLIERLSGYGADMRGIRDRFLGDAELYERCFRDFLEEPNFDLLQNALETSDVAKAFEAAHALKGLSGNLGLTPFYDALCILVEALRNRQLDRLDAQHEAVRSEKARLDALYSGAPVPEPAQAEKKPEPRKYRMIVDRLTLAVGSLLLTAVIGVSLVFTSLIYRYGDQVDQESANHLAEINYQIKLYVEEKIENDWKITHSVANSIVQIANNSQRGSLLAYMAEERNIWGVSEIILYTENGYGVQTDGTVLPNDRVSDVIYYARQRGEYLSIVQSELTYTVPIGTDLTLNGSRIVAVSVMQEIGTFLDKMEFSSFDDTAYLYLTQKNGTVISRLTHESSVSAYNILSLLQKYELICLSDREHNLWDMLSSESSITHLIRLPEGEQYVVSTPVVTHNNELRLFYFVPESVVNKSLDEFSSQITTLSVLVISVFASLALVLFLLVYSSQKKRFNKALDERNRLFNLLIQHSNTAFATFSANRDTPVYLSDNAQDIIGTQYLSLAKTPDGYRMKDDTGAASDAIRQINEEMRGWNGRTIFTSGFIPRPAPDNPGYYSFHLYPVEEEGKEFVGIAQDTTLAHSRENAVREALAMAERSNEAKSRFLSNMSHDIRTPMNAIINMTHFALESADEPRKLLQYLNTILESSEHLLGLINDVLDVSRIESGQALISTEPFDLTQELERVCDIIRPLADDKNQTFLADWSGLQTAHVTGDSIRTSQILINLLSNAVKFTPAMGAIRFTVSELPAIRDGHVSVRFVVEDNGIGISKEDLPYIFDPFMRADRNRVSGVEGTGLGLSICKSYVAALGGTIRCQSEQDNGSTFTVELFYERAEAKAEPPEPKISTDQPFLGRRCLLCEDNPTNQIIAVTLLEKLGFMVDTAPDGAVGVKRFTSSRPGYYDVIYMDIRMPILDGYQAAVAIRSSTHPHARTIPIIAMTANVFAEDIEKSRIAGMNGHLGKPIMVLELVDETIKALNNGGTLN